MQIAVLLLLISVAILCFSRHGHEEEEPFAPKNSWDVQEVVDTLHGVSDETYLGLGALTHGMQTLTQILNELLSRHGFELISIGDSLHYTLKDVTIRHVPSGQFLKCNVVTFMPSPSTGLFSGRILFDMPRPLHS